jgi:hypothetical protein
MSKSRTLTLIILASSILHLLVYAHLLSNLIPFSTLKDTMKNMDFISFYTVGYIFRAGEGELLYNLDAQRYIQDAIIGSDFAASGGVLPFNHPPFLIPLLGFITTESYPATYVRWTLILLGVLALCATIIAITLRKDQWPLPRAALIALSSVLFYPILISLLQGQDTVFVLLGALGWFWGMHTHRERMSGLGLALTTIKPHIALPLALPFIVSRRREGWWFAGWSLLLVLSSLLFIGWQGWLDFFAVLVITAKGEGFGVHPHVMMNFQGLILRLLPWLPDVLLRLLTWGGFMLAISGVCWLWWGKQTIATPQRIGLTVGVALFFSPHLYGHDLALLVVPMLALLLTQSPQPQQQGEQQRRSEIIALLPAGASLLLLVGHLLAGFWFPLVAYGVMGFLIARLLFLWPR